MPPTTSSGARPMAPRLDTTHGAPTSVNRPDPVPLAGYPLGPVLPLTSSPRQHRASCVFRVFGQLAHLHCESRGEIADIPLAMLGTSYDTTLNQQQLKRSVRLNAKHAPHGPGISRSARFARTRAMSFCHIADRHSPKGDSHVISHLVRRAETSRFTRPNSACTARRSPSATGFLPARFRIARGSVHDDGRVLGGQRRHS
jgi:hypothetical protein